MLNLQTVGIKPYTFEDGNRTIKTKNPTQAIYTVFSTKGKDLSWVDMVWENILSEKDYEDYKNLAFDLKLLVLTDYFSYHTEQLEARFRSTPSAE